MPARVSGRLSAKPWTAGACGAIGNSATEDVVYMLRGMGIETGVDLDRLVQVGADICTVLGKKPVSKAGQALLAKRSC